MNLLDLNLDALGHILLLLSVHDINKLCILGPKISQICADENFWLAKVQQEMNLTQPSHGSWRATALRAVPLNIRVLIHIGANIYIGNIHVAGTNNLHDLYNLARQITDHYLNGSSCNDVTIELKIDQSFYRLNYFGGFSLQSVEFGNIFLNNAGDTPLHSLYIAGKNFIDNLRWIRIYCKL